VDIVLLNSLYFYIFELTNELSLSCRHTSFPINCLQIDCLQIDRLRIDHLQIDRLQINFLQNGCLQIFLLHIDRLLVDRFQIDHLQVLLQSRSIMASKCISQLAWSFCGEMAELWLHPKGIHEKEQFWLYEQRNRAERYDRVPAHVEQHNFHGSLKDRHLWVRNHTDWVDRWTMGKSASDQGLEKIDSIFSTMRWCVYSPFITKM